MSASPQVALGQTGGMKPYREGRFRRARRQVMTIVRAVRAGRARVRATPGDATADGEALRDLVAQAAAEARIVEIPVNRRPWTATTVRVTRGEAVTWLAWGHAYLIRSLGLGRVGPSLGLVGRVEEGPPQISARETFTFTADRDGPIEFGGRFPGELQEDGSITVDRVPYRVMRGRFTAVVARWGREVDPRVALQTLAARDPSGLCAVEAARMADPPQPPLGWDHHPLLGREGRLPLLAEWYRRRLSPLKRHYPAVVRGGADPDPSAALVLAGGRAAFTAARGHDAHA
jgi:hypothetical protein